MATAPWPCGQGGDEQRISFEFKTIASAESLKYEESEVFVNLHLYRFELSSKP